MVRSMTVVRTTDRELLFTKKEGQSTQVNGFEDLRKGKESCVLEIKEVRSTKDNGKGTRWTEKESSAGLMVMFIQVSSLRIC